MRIAFGLEYDGSRYHGWQYQRNGLSVQEVLEKAVSRVADQNITIICAGRTDTGVHATGQTIHFDTTAKREEHSWVFGTNSNLPKDVSVCWAKSVDETFHARFSAVERHYRYIIYNHRSRPAILRNQVTWWNRPLSAENMQAAANCLLGEHDFSSFRSVECQSKSPVRKIDTLNVSRNGDYIYIDVQGNAFLHHMVRNIAGVLLAVGIGEKPVDWVAEVLEQRDRKQGGITAPPNGLYLVRIIYPPEFNIPAYIQWPVLPPGNTDGSIS